MNNELRTISARRIAAERARKEAMEDLRVAIRKARDSGMSIAEIARETGHTRQTIYTLLKETS